jgi:hypothetical protein
MVEIEKISCTDSNDACKNERRHIELLGATLNKIIPTRTYQEYNKKYIEDHKDEIREYKKKYHQDHKEELREQQREYKKKYREEHRAEINEKQKKYSEDHKDEINARRRLQRKLKKSTVSSDPI